MSLADELLADFEDDDVNEAESLPTIPEREESQEAMEIDVSVKSVSSFAKLLDSEQLSRVMGEIDSRCDQGGSNLESWSQGRGLRNKDGIDESWSQGRGLRNKDEIDGPIESHPEYLLIVESNNLAVEIDHEMRMIEQHVKEKYSRRFPELESLIPTPLEYMMAVRELGNDLSRVKSNQTLASFLTQATIMILSVTASTTAGKPLSQCDLDSLLQACDMAVQLNRCRVKILSFVESQMSIVAPNISAITGADVAAKLMAAAGGLRSLSKMPACNVEVVGRKRKTLGGFSSSILPHTGFIWESQIVQSAPPDLRRKAARLVSNKCTIAARVDAMHAATDGSAGRLFREQIEKALDRLQEPPPVKQVKALPAPIDVPGKKRGGKRVRRQKERLAMSEFRKQQNRMNFGDIEDDAYQNDLGFTTGTIGKSGKGRIRAPQVDEKTKVRISKALQRNLQKQNTTFGGTTSIKRQVSGTASSVAFTPLQGLEIVNPGAAENQSVESGSAKYFSNTSGFSSVKK